MLALGNSGDADLALHVDARWSVSCDTLQQFVLQRFQEQWWPRRRSRPFGFAVHFRTFSRGRFETDEDLLNRAEPAPEIDFTAEPAAATEETKSIRYDALAPAMIAFLAICVVAGRVSMAAAPTGDWRLFETLRECALGSRARGRGSAATPLGSEFLHPCNRSRGNRRSDH